MSGLVVTFKDNDHFTQQWTMTNDGKASEPYTFEYERVKQSGQKSDFWLRNYEIEVGLLPVSS